MNDESKVAEVLANQISLLPAGEPEDPMTFVIEVQQFLVNWRSAYPDNSLLDQPAYSCFIGCQRVGSFVLGFQDFKKCSQFRDDTPQDLLGKIYLSSFPLNAVFSKEASFSSFGDCENAVLEIADDGTSVVVFNAAANKIFWATKVDGGFEWKQAFLTPKKSSGLNSGNFDDELNHFHYEYTSTPQGLVKPWLNAGKLIPKPDLEGEIRDYLYVHLRGLAHHQFAVLRELYGAAGRTDLLVIFNEEKLPSCYVELKVLIKYRMVNGSPVSVSENESTTWGKKGIAQAFNYRRSNRGVGFAYACCFDCRKDDNEIQELVDFAKEKDVNYRRYFIHSSADGLHSSVM